VPDQGRRMSIFSTDHHESPKNSETISDQPLIGVNVV
jgi:hypothetical protein